MVALCRRDAEEWQGRAKHCGDVRGHSGPEQIKGRQGTVGEWHGRIGQSRRSMAGRDVSRAGSGAFFNVPHNCHIMSCSLCSSAGAVFFLYFIIGPFIFYNRSVYILYGLGLYFIFAPFIFYKRPVHIFCLVRARKYEPNCRVCFELLL